MTISSARSENPFLDAYSFQMPTATVGQPRLSSPFIEAFTFEDMVSDPRDSVRRVLRAQLYDEEFDDTVYELIGELSGVASNNSDARYATTTGRLHLAPLADEAEDFIQRAADAFGSRDAGALTDSEIDEVIGRLESERSITPGFENIFGSIAKAVKRAAKGAVSLAKKGIAVATALGLGPILQKLKKLIRPLLERVLKAAINRLPVAVQPAATKLASKLPMLFGEVEAGSNDELGIDVGAIQSEFNDQTIDLLLGESHGVTDEEATPWSTSSADEVGIGDLDAARERFVHELEQLSDSEDPGPTVERFIPALLPVLKLGLRIAGRKRVVGLLSGLVSKLIARFVGPQASGALSTALVDAGLKLIGLEVSDTDQRRTGTSALAATVEETVRRVAALPDAVLDNEALLEGSVVQAFEEAAASNLPPVLSANAYRHRPELVETDSRRGTWVSLPLRGRKRYKKFSRVMRTRITPRTAMALTTFGEASLAQFLQEQLGLDPGEELEAELHFYESLPGTVLGEVARLEGNGGSAASMAEFHPLTPDAAALLVQEPGLGRAMSPANRSAPKNIAVGQRFYRIAVPGRRIASIPGVSGKGNSRRRTRLHTVLDFPADRIRLYLFLSERRAQELAATLRKQGHAGAIASRLKAFIDRGLAAAAHGNITGRIRIVHEAVSLPEARGAALGKPPAAAVQAFTARIGEWTLTALTEFFTAQAARFIAATEDAKDGVTVIVTLTNPPGMAAMRGAVGGAASTGTASTKGKAETQVDVAPGFTNG